MATVTLTNINKVYDGNVHAVIDFNLKIKDKEFIVFVGPSGCGKTTTLRMVAGLEEITSGELRIDDEIVNDVAPKDRNIAMVFQSYALYPHMTVYDNMAFSLKLRKTPKDEIDRRVKEAAEILGLTQYLDRKPKALSGGQRQRVALGRAIVRKPKVFLMDEPLSNLDAKLRVQMRSQIIKIHERVGSTTIYVTHDQIEAMTMATRIVCMKDGRVQQIGSPKELYAAPANKFVAGFMGSPAMNFMLGTVENGSFVIDGSSNTKIALPADKRELLKNFAGQKVILGIRPEDIKYSQDQDFNKPTVVSVNCEADVVELLGDTLQIYSYVDDQKFVVKTSSMYDVRMHDRITVGLDLAMCHFFDSVSENRIVSSDQVPASGEKNALDNDDEFVIGGKN